MKKLLFSLAFCLLAGASLGFAQPRPAENMQTPKTAPRTIVPESFQAKYEGGMIGFDKKLEGTLKFDDANERLVFFGEDQKEKFSIAYDAMLSVYTGKKSVRSAAGTAISVIPLPGAGLAGLIREKRRYLVIHYSDSAVEARGVTSFKIENDQIREAVIDTLGEKANLTKRGDAYVRAKATAKTNEQ
ncbi:MAG TPA: hypothetical protein VF556_18110 [Pyrinomonadaceae bacterium]|jgi:hypothetical protein